MIVHSIALDFFRNYVHLDARFSPEVNVIYGENAQGKTNLLEAVAYLSTASSHRARYDRELIQFGVDHAFVKAEVSARGRDFTLEARLGRGVRRQLYSNGVRLKSAGELSGVLNTVLFCPEDLYLIREGAATRRRFLDGCICQLRPKYAEALAEYRRLYEHKVRILRDWEEHPSLLDTLDEFNLRMAQTGALLIHYRAHFVKRLREVTPPIHLDFSGGREELGLAYETVSTVTDPEDSPRSILHQLLAHPGEPPEGGAGVPPVPLRPPQGRSHRGAERHERQDLPPPRGRPAPRRCPSSWPPGRSFIRRPASGRCCCWTMCSASWTPGGRSSCSGASTAGRCSSPAVRTPGWRVWRRGRSSTFTAGR